MVYLNAGQPPELQEGADVQGARMTGGIGAARGDGVG